MFRTPINRAAKPLSEGCTSAAFSRAALGGDKQAMPYVNLKLYPGRSEEQKREAARRIAEVVSEVCKVAPGAEFPVIIEDVAPEDWHAAIDPELQAKSANRYDR